MDSEPQRGSSRTAKSPMHVRHVIARSGLSKPLGLEAVRGKLCVSASNYLRELTCVVRNGRRGENEGLLR